MENPNVAGAASRLIESGPLSIVQVGAFVGATGNDPLYDFFESYSANRHERFPLKVVLVEPVKRFFRQLVVNTDRFADFASCENVAIADALGIRPFYVLSAEAERTRVDFPEWTSQLGSLLPNRITDLWDSFEKNVETRAFLNANTVTEQVVTITFDQLLSKNDLETVDTIQIDAEGYDFETVKTIDLNRIRPKVLNYESVLLRDEIEVARQYLAGFGYRSWPIGLDTFALREDYAWLLEQLPCPGEHPL